jgi:hypothetical protein
VWLLAALSSVKVSLCLREASNALNKNGVAQLAAQRHMFELFISRMSRHWEWRVCDASGKIMMEGREKSRAAARYQGERALFLLLLTTCPRV